MDLKCTLFFLLACIMFNICNCNWIWPDDEIYTSHYRAAEYVRPKRQSADEFHPLSQKYDFLDWKLFQKVSAQNKGKNIIMSPVSVKILLALTKEAAASKTKQEIDDWLQDLPRDGLNWFDEIISSLEEKNSLYELDTATKIYLDKELKPQKTFLKTGERYFHTSTEIVNFKNTKKTAKIINNWASNITKGNIENIVTEDGMEAYAAVLANAIYFKGAWERHFKKEDTIKDPFIKDDKNIEMVWYMTKNDPAYFLDTTELGGAKLLQLPYKGGKFAITFILPHFSNNLDKLIASIKPGQILKLQQQLKSETVNLFLPKFDFKTDLKLKSTLLSLNISKVFTNGAELPGLGASRPIGLDDVIQKAGIKIDEEGTRVEVASAAIFGFRSGINDEISFRADRPFAFFIEDVTSGALLFAGQVHNPNAKN